MQCHHFISDFHALPMILELNLATSPTQSNFLRRYKYFAQASSPMKTSLKWAVALLLLCSTSFLPAQVPQLINYQGRVGVDGVNFDGSGQFKFAFVDAAGTDTYWSNDGSSMAGSEPATAVSIPVSKGLYSILLGDATQVHMTIVPSTVFVHGDVHLRVWFSDGVKGFQQLAPDRRVAAVGYALMANSVSDGAITTAKIADGSVTSEKLAAGVVQTSNLATGAVGNIQLANSALTINAGTGLGGGGLVSLGGNVSLSNSGVLSLTSGGGITVDSATGVVTLGSSATSVNTAGAIVARDANGEFTAGTITAALNGNAATATSATSFTGLLTGDVTGTQSATTIADATVTGKLLTGFTSAAGTLAASDTLLSAISKLDGNLALKTPLASPTFTGSVTLPAGSATTAPLMLQTGTNLTTPTFGAVEFDGTNVFVTNNSASPTRKTIAFTDTPLVNAQIADGSVTSAKIANGSIGSINLAANAVQAGNIATGAVGSTQLASGAAAANLNASGQTGVPSGGLVLSATENPTLVNAGYTLVSSTLGTVEWRQRVTSSSPSGRVDHMAVWTGSEMIVWGGSSSIGLTNEGGRFNPSTNSWLAMSTTNAPTARSGRQAIWTGSEMIVWGGRDSTDEGGRYNPVTDTWIAMSIVGAPNARYNHSAVWTGTEMIIWGGFYYAGGSVFLNSGWRYNPTSDSWMPINTSGAPEARGSHTTIWTGSEMIIWGGSYSGSLLKSGGRYNPTSDSWIAVSTTSAPEGRLEQTAVWTGSEMIIWGGTGSEGTNFNKIGRYDPTTNSWTSLSSTASPVGRYGHSAVWTGSEMIIWGGYGGSLFNDGSRYNPASNTWTQITAAGAPLAREHHRAVWTGSDMIISGGTAGATIFSDTFSYSPGRSLFLYQRP
jgi:N-acetylneuraminic acid mutarotase